MYAQPSKSDRRGIPIDNLIDSYTPTAISGETVQFYYNNSGTLTADAGQAIGSIVVAKLAWNHVLNQLGGNIGIYGDTSLSFTSTAFTTLINFGPESMESFDDMTEVERLQFLGGLSTTQKTPFTAVGQYFVDHNRGILYGMKASVQTTLVNAAYLIPETTSGSTPSSSSMQEVTANVSGVLLAGATNYASQDGLQTTYIPLYVATAARTVTQFQAVSRVSNGAAHTDTYTVVKNGIDTTMTFSITNGTTGTTTSNQVALVSGDTIGFKVVTGAGTVGEDVLIAASIS